MSVLLCLAPKYPAMGAHEASPDAEPSRSPLSPPCSSCGTALCRDLLQTPSTLHGLRPYSAFLFHIGGLRFPLAGQGGHDAIHAGHLEIPRGWGAIQMQNVIIFPGLKQRPEKG